MAGEEAVVTMLSWVGRVILTRFIGDDHSFTETNAREAIDNYQVARNDLAHAIDSILHGIIAHGVLQPSFALIHAVKFLSSSLECVAETSNHCTVCRGSGVSQVVVNASQWLPSISFLVRDEDDETTPRPTVAQAA